MDIFLPQGFEPGLGRPRRQAFKPDRQLHVQAGSIRFPVLRSWATGFATDAESVPALSGLIEVFDGAERQYQGLIVASHTQGRERIFEVKRAPEVSHRALPGREVPPGVYMR